VDAIGGSRQWMQAMDASGGCKRRRMQAGGR
jgi:hypothetical protein